MRILLIEDEKVNRLTLDKILTQSNYEVVAKEDGISGLKSFENEYFDLVITDLKLPGLTGGELLERFKQISPEIPVIIMTAFATVDNAVNCLKSGAYDYFTKPFQPEELLNIIKNIKREIELQKEILELKQRLSEQTESSNVIGKSQKFMNVLKKVDTISAGDHTVLIEGESGTGKEVITDLIVKKSNRSEKPLIKVNCSALSESLFESEMFGHEKGAFTGALKQSKGRFERANKGTILLDDIDDLSMEMQVKLLRVIQEREIERVGGDKVIPIDIRIIAATKTDLRKKVSAGEFREDFYYRLNVVNLHLPPLRERKIDIPLLATYFLQKYAKDKTYSAEVIDILQEYNWPGNIRELQNAIEQITALINDELIKPEHLPNNIKEKFIEQTIGVKRTVWQHIFDKHLSLDETLSKIEFDILSTTMIRFDRKQQKVADYLGIPRTTLRSKLEKYKLL